MTDPLPLLIPSLPRRELRFALPPSLGPRRAQGKADQLEAFLTQALARPCEVRVAESYASLARDLLTSRVDAAWAPPFVCARIEAMGVRVLVRGVRQGASSYRAALLCRRDDAFTLEQLSGRTAVWVDRDSVGGYLLAVAFLRAKRPDLLKTLKGQGFAGSYHAALEQLLEGKADLTSVFAPLAKRGEPELTGLAEILPGRDAEVSVIAFTEEAPNDGVAVAVGAPDATTTALEKVLLSLGDNPAGKALLTETFRAERFEPAPRMGYRALYRVALAGL